eukprot:41175_1
MLTLLSLVSSVSPTLTSSTFSFYPFFLSACASSVYSSMHTVHCHSNRFLINGSSLEFVSPGSSLEFVSPMCMACPYYYHTPSITYKYWFPIPIHLFHDLLVHNSINTYKLYNI